MSYNYDLKYSLRKLNFPFSVRESLFRVEQLLQSRSSYFDRLQNIKQTELAMELIAEFVFAEVDRRRMKREKLTSKQELQILEILSNYFSHYTMGNTAPKNAVFLSLFPHTHIDRCILLTKLVSIALSTHNMKLILSAGVLIQQIGCTSKYSVQLARGFVHEFIVLYPKNCYKLRQLSKTSSLFTANLLTAISELYFNIDNDKKKPQPKKLLLHVITKWILESNSMCYAAVVSNVLPALPLGGIAMPAVTPFVGLAKWGIISPLFAKSKEIYFQEKVRYSTLHLVLLENIADAAHHCPNPTQRSVVSAQHITALISIIRSKFRLVFHRTNFGESQPWQVDLCLNRLGQFLLSVLNSSSLYGNKQELVCALKSLPKNRLIKLALCRHLELFE